ncbi:MAG: tetratricopeptide repeat protein [Flavobacteriales bacterium]|nr:tetratricopeptide repeat protein [Flavobacteriales bacterium]
MGFCLLWMSACDPSVSESDIKEKADTTSTVANIYLHINERIKANPNDPKLYLERSKLYLENLEYDLAYGDADRALYLDSNLAPAYHQRALVNLEKGQLELANEALKLAMSLDSNFIPARLKMAELQLVLRKYGESIRLLDEVLRIDVYNADAYFFKGMTFLMTQDSSKAISSFQTAIDQNNNHYESYIQLGLIFANRNDPLAAQYYQSALQVKPKSIEALYNLSYYYQSVEDIEKALTGYDQILELDSLNRNALFNKGYCFLVFKNQYDSAAMIFTDIVEYFPKDYNALCNRAICYENLGDKKGAEEDFRACLKIKPDFTLAALGLSRLGV